MKETKQMRLMRYLSVLGREKLLSPAQMQELSSLYMRSNSIPAVMQKLHQLSDEKRTKEIILCMEQDKILRGGTKNE